MHVFLPTPTHFSLTLTEFNTEWHRIYKKCAMMQKLRVQSYSYDGLVYILFKLMILLNIIGAPKLNMALVHNLMFLIPSLLLFCFSGISDSIA